MGQITVVTPMGFRASAVRAGIKQSGALDLGLIVADGPCVAAGTFTTNKVVGAAVEVSREHIRSGRAQAVFVNAGNANTCTGARGLQDAGTICKAVGRVAGVEPGDVLVCSTGVIGHFLPMDKVKAGIEAAGESLGSSAKVGRDFARAIMTTDLMVKQAGRTIRLGGKEVHIAGTAKGSGMIAPNMATMLAFVTTDADIAVGMLRRALKRAVYGTFNKVSVDSHMSTSDTAIVLASGRAGNKQITGVGADYDRFAGALLEVCDELARMMAADGEGATAAITIRVTGAASPKDARKAVRAIADSPLVRTAFNGADPNWGRIVSAVGYSGARFEPEKTVCKIAGTVVFRNGRPSRFDADKLSKKMKGKQWDVVVELGLGSADDFCYTCDLSREYVTINADYHT